MGGGHRLPRGPGSGASRIILSDFAGGRVSLKGGFADIRHPEYPRPHPFSERNNGISRPMVVREFLLKMRQDALNAINRPGGKGFLVCYFYKFEERLVYTGE
jgi:hypothetical protein